MLKVEIVSHRDIDPQVVIDPDLLYDTVDGPVLLLASDDFCLAIEGTREDLLALADRIHTAVTSS